MEQFIKTPEFTVTREAVCYHKICTSGRVLLSFTGEEPCYELEVTPV